MKPNFIQLISKTNSTTFCLIRFAPSQSKSKIVKLLQATIGQFHISQRERERERVRERERDREIERLREREQGREVG